MFASAPRASGFPRGSPLLITEGAKLCTSAAALVLVRFNHVASGIANADHSRLLSTAMICVLDCVAVLFGSFALAEDFNTIKGKDTKMRGSAVSTRTGSCLEPKR